MKRMSLMLFAVLTTAVATAQIQVSTFKYKWGFPLGVKSLFVKFKNTSYKDLKYVYFHYYTVNAVGDVVSGVNAGVTNNGNSPYVKPKALSFTGPLKSGKSGSGSGGAVVATSEIRAVPRMIEIITMDNDTTKIDITKDNLKQYFPKLEWIDYNINNKAL